MDLKYGLFLFGSECNTVFGYGECGSEYCGSVELRASGLVE
jgi:hypothetical protein